VLAARLGRELAARLPAGAPRFDLSGGLTPAALAGLDPALRGAYAQAFTSSLHVVFTVAAVVAAVGFAVAWLLPERPLRRSIAVATADDIGGDVGEAFAMPTAADSLPQVLRALRMLADRDVREAYMERIASSAGVQLPATAARLLLRFDEHGTSDIRAAGLQTHLAPAEVDGAVAVLRERGFVEERGPSAWAITDAGCAALCRLVEARRASLSELFADWPAEKRAEFADVLARLARQLVPDARTTQA
jgi:DNA-binding MarR family transcriptional regulator